VPTPASVASARPTLIPCALAVIGARDCDPSKKSRAVPRRPHCGGNKYSSVALRLRSISLSYFSRNFTPAS
jgi:hypothetical protein